MKLSRLEQKILTLLARLQPVKKDEFLDHAECLDMGIDDREFRKAFMHLWDSGLVDVDLKWRMYIPTAEELANRPYCGGG